MAVDLGSAAGLDDMTVEPDFDDASSILWGLAGAAVAAGLVY